MGHRSGISCSIILSSTMSSSLCVTKCIACLGIILSSLALAPVIYTHMTDRDHSTLLPWLGSLQEALLEEFHKKSITQTTLDSLQGCLNTIGENAIVVSLAIVACSGTNILIDFFLLIGACCGVRCLLVPWLLVSMIQLIFLGCPTVIFFSLLGTYLLLQGQFLLSLVSFSTPTFLVLVAMTVWLTVLAAYWALGTKTAHEYSKATAKARLAHLDGYKIVQHQQHGKRRDDGHRHSRHQAGHSGHSGHSGHVSHPAPGNNPNLYPTLPLA